MENKALNLLLAQNVYSMATQSALQIFELSRGFAQGGPKSIRAKLISTSGNICSHLSAAWQNRNTRNVFIENLNHASTHTAQVIDFIQESLDFDFIDKPVADDLTGKYQQIFEKINEMLENVTLGTKD
ncbi:MAG: four helix bundle protein [bacterium]